tara:strand:+ start:2081 stop:3709 length:1629 start_codon:yes stop_codon:yes gene_type:complete
MWTPRKLPEKQHRYRFAKFNPVHPVGAVTVGRAIETESGAIGQDGLFDWIVEAKDAYTVCPESGQFDALFHGMPEPALRALANGEIVPYGQFRLTYHGRGGRFSPENILSVRKGNRWGRLVNVARLIPDADSPQAIAQGVRDAIGAFRSYGFPRAKVGRLAFRSVGRTSQEIIMSQVEPFPSPPEPHLSRFHDSFRGARMEASILGLSDVVDYDVTAAYPSIIADLVSTEGMEWVDSTEPPAQYDYAAALCDVDVAELQRGSIGVRVGPESLFFPVGRLTNVWLNAPELRLLAENPELGRVRKIHKASWGVSGDGLRPLRRTMAQLYKMRKSEPTVAGYLKVLMAGVYGKFIGITKGKIAGPLWNPAIGSHITSRMRSDNFAHYVPANVVGEWIDGAAVVNSSEIGSLGLSDVEPGQAPKMGDTVEEGRGEICVLTDQHKLAPWKQSAYPIQEAAQAQMNSNVLRMDMQTHYTLGLALSLGERISAVAGERVNIPQAIPVGSALRIHDDVTIGQLLRGPVETYAPRQDDLRGMIFERGLGIV